MPRPQPLITTVIPTFNRAHLLPRAVGSVLNQGRDDVVIHVLDNASTDATSEVVGRMLLSDDRIKYTRRRTNIGLIENFLNGFDLVSTPYFSLLSDDDWLLPGFYASAIADFERYPELGFCGGFSRYVLADGSTLEVARNISRTGLFEPQELLYYGVDNRPPITGLVFRTEAVRQTGGLQPSCGVAFDVHLLLTVAVRFSVVINATLAAAITVAEDTATASTSSISYLRNCRSMTRAISRMPELQPRAAVLLKEQLQESAWFVGARSVVIGRTDDALEAALILGEEGAFGRAKVLSSAARLSKEVPIVLPMLRTVAITRTLVKRLSRDLLTRGPRPGEHSGYGPN